MALTCARISVNGYVIFLLLDASLVNSVENGWKFIIRLQDETVVRHQVQMSREQKAMNRRLLTTMADTNSDLFKVNQLKVRIYSS